MQWNDFLSPPVLWGASGFFILFYVLPRLALYALRKRQQELKDFKSNHFVHEIDIWPDWAISNVDKNKVEADQFVVSLEGLTASGHIGENGQFFYGIEIDCPNKFVPYKENLHVSRANKAVSIKERLNGPTVIDLEGKEIYAMKASCAVFIDEDGNITIMNINADQSRDTITFMGNVNPAPFLFPGVQ